MSHVFGLFITMNNFCRYRACVQSYFICYFNQFGRQKTDVASPTRGQALFFLVTFHVEGEGLFKFLTIFIESGGELSWCFRCRNAKGNLQCFTKC